MQNQAQRLFRFSLPQQLVKLFSSARMKQVEVILLFFELLRFLSSTFELKQRSIRGQYPVLGTNILAWMLVVVRPPIGFENVPFIKILPPCLIAIICFPTVVIHHELLLLLFSILFLFLRLLRLLVLYQRLQLYVFVLRVHLVLDPLKSIVRYA